MTIQLNERQLAVASRLVANARNPMNAQSTSIYQNVIGQSVNHKHDLYYDFGYPGLNELTFENFYQLWKRNGWASGLVEKTVSKTWQDDPQLREDPDAHEETPREEEIRKHFAKIRFWQFLKITDGRGMVGKYSGVVLQLADGQTYDQPVVSVPGGIEGLISVIPAWEKQLEPSAWDTDPTSPTYGSPSMFRFNESSVDPEAGKTRSFSVHPDRCLIWSADGTVFGESKFECCYNALLDMEKIRGAGGEGFWKNAKGQPVLSADKEVDFNQLASMLGTDIEGLGDALDDVVSRWTKGFDESLVLQGMTATTLSIALEKPAEFFETALMEVSASWPIPQKTLTGMQTGERASTEDAREWAQTNMGRRTQQVDPSIQDLVRRFEAWGMLEDKDWTVEWSDLTAPTQDERLTIADKMASVNQRMFATGEAVFTDAEIREIAGYDGEPEGDTTILTEFDRPPEEEEVDDDEPMEEEDEV